jgi:hypothetical protein
MNDKPIVTLKPEWINRRESVKTKCMRCSNSCSHSAGCKMLANMSKVTKAAVVIAEITGCHHPTQITGLWIVIGSQE